MGLRRLDFTLGVLDLVLRLVECPGKEPSEEISVSSIL